MNREKKTLLGLLAGNALYIILICIIGIIFVDNKGQWIWGTLWSGIGATVVTIHLYFSLQKSLELDQGTAQKRESIQSILRMIIMIIVIGSGLILSKVFHPIGVVLGAFALKVSAYLQLLLHNYISPKEEE